MAVSSQDLLTRIFHHRSSPECRDAVVAGCTARCAKGTSDEREVQSADRGSGQTVFIPGLVDRSEYAPQ